MPVAAVAGAVFAGAEIASVGIAAMSALQVVAAVGAIASGIGVLTGNKELAMIGGVASLAAGVGSFAQGKGWMSGDVASADAGAMAQSAAKEASNTSQMIQEAAPGVVDPSAAVTTDVTQAGGAATDVAEFTPAGAADAQVGATGAFAENGLINSGGVAGNSTAALVAGPGSAPASGGLFDTLKGFSATLKDNKELTSMAGNFIGGFFDKKKEAEAAAANASTDLYKARTQNEILQGDLARQSAANANSVPDLTGMKLNKKDVFANKKNPVYYGPRAGLINS